jgi:T5SS/PEP-CTERM-associated repeat protein
MLNYMDGGQVTVGSYNVSGHAGSSSRLDILDGAGMLVVTKHFGSGGLAGDTDLVNIDGPGSDLELSGNLAVGDGGQGSFTLGNGALVERVKGLSLGVQKSGKGTVSVDGQETRFQLDGNLVVGDNGQGSLSISDGGIVKGADDVTLGAQKSGRGTVSIDGKGSGFSHYSGDLVAGDQGQGSLTITGRARVSLQDVTLGKQQSGQGDITVDGGKLFVFGTMTLGAKGEGTLSLARARTVELKTLVLGVSASGDGTVDVSDAELKATKSVTIGENGSGVIAVHGAGFFEGDHVTIGSKGKLTVDSLSGAMSGATLSGVTTIEKDGLLAVKGHHAGATLAPADISGRISVSDGGYVLLTKAIVGDGEITIGKQGTLHLKGTDHGVDIRFAASGKAATLYLDHANLLDHAIVKGFAKGNDIEFTNLALNDVLLSVARRGANTVVTIRDEDGHKLGALTLAGHYARSSLDFDHGTLTTDGPSKAAVHTEAAAAMTHDDFLFAKQAAADAVDADAPTQRGDGEVATNTMHVFHDYGW